MSASHFNEVFQIFEKAFGHQNKMGIDALQLTAQISSKKGIGVFEKKMDSLELAHETKIGVWLKKDSRLATLSLEKISWDALEKALNTAVDLSRYSDPDENYALAGAAQSLDSVQECDSSMKEIEQKALALEEASFQFSPQIKNVPEASVGERAFSSLVMNSEGLKILQSHHYAFASVSLISEGKDLRPSNVYEACYAKDLQNLNISSFAAECASECLKRLNPITPHSGNYPIVFDPQMSAHLLSSFASIFSGDLLYKHLSKLEGRLGESLASSKVSILDSAQKGFIPHHFDGEGNPCNDHYLIEKGVFKSFLHNHYTASKTSSLNTSNASYSMGSPAGVGPSNVSWEGELTSIPTLVQSIDQGILIKQLHGASASPITGDFSYGAQGYFIEKGKVTSSLADFTLAGNFFELLKNIEAIGDDLTYFSPHLLGSVGGRSLLIRQMAVAGK